MRIEINETNPITELFAASIHSLATPVGSLLAGPLVDAMGRRSTLQLAAIPMCIGWLLIGFAANISMMLVGRFAAGFGVGICSVTAQVFYLLIIHY